MTTTQTSGLSGRRRVVVIAAAIGVALVAAAAIWFFFIRADSPTAFDIDDATASLDAGDAGTDPAEDADSAQPAGFDGAWTVDPSAGADAGGSSAGYRVDEELASIGATTAVGRTSEVDGTLVVNGTAISDVQVTVDLASVTSDDDRRDNRMRSALDVDQFPTATFVLTDPIVLDAIPEVGETVTVTASGEMTIKGVTNPVDVTLDASVVDDVLVVVGTVPVTFSDYEVEAPTSPIALSVDDNGTIEFRLFFTRS